MSIRLIPALLAGILGLTQCREKPHTVAPSPATTEPSVTEALLSEFSGERAHQHIARIIEFGPRPPASPGLKRTHSYLESTLQSYGWRCFRQTFRASTPQGEVQFTNLIAKHAAHLDTPSAVVLGGHLDSKMMPYEFVGANDGGSSTGILLELARVIGSQTKAATGVEFVFFDGEEAFGPNITASDGLYGSKFYARELSTRPVRPRNGIILDIVGDPEFPLLFNPDAPEIFQQRVREIGRHIEFPGGLEAAPGMIIDDHIPLQHAGVPCLHLIGDFTSMDYWHQPGDTLDKVKPEMLDRVGKLTLEFLYPRKSPGKSAAPEKKAVPN